MKERKILSQEVEFLRKQLIAKIPSEPVTPFMETASHSSAEVPGHMAEEKERDAWCVAFIDPLWTLFADLCPETNWKTLHMKMARFLMYINIIIIIVTFIIF